VYNIISLRLKLFSFKNMIDRTDGPVAFQSRVCMWTYILLYVELPFYRLLSTSASRLEILFTLKTLSPLRSSILNAIFHPIDRRLFS